MSSTGTITLAWRNGEDKFCLAKVGELLALEEKCNAGVMAIAQRLRSDQWYINDIRETIRLGLIGGGMSSEKAMVAVKLHVDGQPLVESALLAYAVLAAAIVGVPDDAPKQQAADAKTGPERSTTTAASAAQPSSESVQPSDGRQAKPTGQPFGNSAPASLDTIEPTAAKTTSPQP